MIGCTIKDIETSFSSFVEERGGKLHDISRSDESFFGRCILPQHEEVTPGDFMNAGVAVFCDGGWVEVRPYLFRQVCVNGAISITSTTGARMAVEDCIHGSFMEALESCSTNEVFQASLTTVRSIVDRKFDIAMMVSSFVRAHRADVDSRAIFEVMRRLRKEGDPSGYGLMNAVTSLGRDTHDPKRKWRLEEAGGSIPALLIAEVPDKPRAEAIDLPIENLRGSEELQPV